MKKAACWIGLGTLLTAASLLMAAAPGQRGGGMVCVGVIYTIQAGHEAGAVEDLRQLQAATRKEPGNVMYLIHQATDNPRQFLIYEQYRSQADLDAHRAKDYFQRYSVNGLQKIAESRVAGSFTPL